MKKQKKGREWLLREAGRLRFVVPMMRVFLAGVAAFVFVFELLLPLLHVMGVGSNGMRIPVLLHRDTAEPTEVARREGVVVVEETRAELFVSGADMGQRFLFRLPQMLTAALVLGVLLMLWLVLRRCRSQRFVTKGTLRQLGGAAYLLMGMSLVGVFVTDWCATALAADAGVAASAVAQPHMSALLGTACVLVIALTAWHSELNRLLGTGRPTAPLAAAVETAAPLTFSEPEEVAPRD